jgi:hypothetical protein
VGTYSAYSLLITGHVFFLRYLNDIDYDVQYGGLGVTPLPLHGQVRPIKVEQQEQEGGGGWGADTTLSTTPPILRRRARKREADDSEVRPWLISINL